MVEIGDLLELAAVYAGILVEGELVYFSAMVACKLGNLSLVSLMLTAFLGALTRDLLIFHLSRFSTGFVAKIGPRQSQKIKKVTQWIHGRPVYVMIFHRFVYGLSTAVVMACGLSSMQKIRFYTITFIACILWTLVYGVLGYYFAEWILEYFDSRDISMKPVIWIFLAGIAIYFGSVLLRKRRNRVS